MITSGNLTWEDVQRAKSALNSCEPVIRMEACAALLTQSKDNWDECFFRALASLEDAEPSIKDNLLLVMSELPLRVFAEFVNLRKFVIQACADTNLHLNGSLLIARLAAVGDKDAERIYRLMLKSRNIDVVNNATIVFQRTCDENGDAKGIDTSDDRN